ncbi:MAG: DUF4249 domain-containing protein [Bacteroidota bacterium]
MKKTIIILSIILLAALSISSCTKVVDINLNEAASKIIIEGSIADLTSSCFVKLSKTVNFDEPNTFPAVSGAIIIITDDLGNTATLTETTDGIYTAPAFQGVVGRTYTISVTAEGKTYTANSTMPEPVAIDTITQEIFYMGGFGGGDTNIFVSIKYHDPAGINNYYRFVEIINGIPSNAIHVDDDRLRDGNTITREIFERDSDLQTGDSVIVFLQTIDESVFDYFKMLDQLGGGGNGGQTATPANPTSNFDNGALGFFSANAVRSKKIIIQ